jgi:hypothetical protein
MIKLKVAFLALPPAQAAQGVFSWRENRSAGLPPRSLRRPQCLLPDPRPWRLSARRRRRLNFCLIDPARTLPDVSAQLATRDWYERVAQSRRKRAIRAFDVACEKAARRRRSKGAIIP